MANLDFAADRTSPETLLMLGIACSSSDEPDRLNPPGDRGRYEGRPGRDVIRANRPVGWIRPEGEATDHGAHPGRDAGPEPGPGFESASAGAPITSPAA